MKRTCTLILGHLGDKVCGQPAVAELTIGPRPFVYRDACAGHANITGADGATVESHPIPEALR